jgi:hypothetical protein
MLRKTFKKSKINKKALLSAGLRKAFAGLQQAAPTRPPGQE